MGASNNKTPAIVILGKGALTTARRIQQQAAARKDRPG